MRYCVDANVVIAQLIPQERTAQIDDFWIGLDRDDEIVGAQILLPECTSALRLKVSQKVITHDEAMEMLADVALLPIRPIAVFQQFERALDLAHRTNRSRAYDMQYVAVAELEHCEMVTLDGGVYQAAVEIGVPARLLR